MSFSLFSKLRLTRTADLPALSDAVDGPKPDRAGTSCAGAESAESPGQQASSRQALKGRHNEPVRQVLKLSYVSALQAFGRNRVRFRGLCPRQRMFQPFGLYANRRSPKRSPLSFFIPGIPQVERIASVATAITNKAILRIFVISMRDEPAFVH